ncbi:hypothetical protein RRG08_045749 [Elysia crispata]|uniref:Ig-like domain-containing protein n=1 Tax=Elysia crispata TaxID=231223 RepID=A0AAE0Z8W0_9GAST|nr:hypothetical protein RRG08_045749 [Elysia crispata]
MACIANSITKPLSQALSLDIGERILVLAIYLIYFTILIPVAATCPSICSCSTTNAAGKTASCGPGLAGFPQGLPTDTASISLNPPPSQAPNDIPSVRAIDLNSFRDLTWLTIRRSNVQQISPAAFLTLTKLLGLDLRDNKIQHLSRSNLVGLSSLVTLDISDNRGCILDSDTFKDIPQLRILRIANIGLDALGQVLNSITSLAHLDLHGNNLFRIHGTSMRNLKNLRHLDLSGNDLYGIDEDAGPVLSSLAALDLDSNTWRCNCAFTWIKSLPRKFVAPTGGGRMPIVCSQPPRLAFLNVWDVQSPQMTCSAAVVSFCTGPVTVWAGDQITITCDVEGDPFPDVHWYRPDGTKVQADVTFATADTATLTRITADYSLHHGSWVVKVVSYNTTASMSVQVTVLTVTTQSGTTTTTMSQHAVNTQTHNNHNSINSNSIHYTSHSPSSPRSSPFTSSGGRLVTNLAPTSTSSVSQRSVVCIVGMAVFALTVYKIRQKRQIHARRRRRSTELYRHTENANSGAINDDRSSTDWSYFLRPLTATQTDSASVRNDGAVDLSSQHADWFMQDALELGKSG